MPPRYAYWTILIDHKPTAFRAREKEELQPTFHQLQRTNKDVVVKWFARGRLWETPEQARAASHRGKAIGEKRGHDWRPGGQHKDPRDRFKRRLRPAPSEKGGAPGAAPALGYNSRGATSGSLEPQAPGVGPGRRKGYGAPRVFDKGPRPPQDRRKPADSAQLLRPAQKPAQTVKKPE